MTIELEEIRSRCLQKPGASEDFPFGPDVIVFRVAGKIFCLANLEDVPSRVNLKCEPERAVELRDAHPEAIVPGWHMNKRHWNTIYLGGVLPDALVLDLVDHSYERVVAGLTRAARAALDAPDREPQA